MFGFLSDLESGFFVAEKISFNKKGDSFLVLSPDRKNIIELKDVAFTIWENIQKPISFENLLKKIKSEYDVSEKDLKNDLKSWLKEALKEKIIKKTKNV